MREILFRGKREDNGEWVEGFFVSPCNIVFEAIGYDEVLEQKNVPICHDYAVIPETVGQYTGLIDKNGKKIFEGDIVKGELSTMSKIEFINGSFRLVCLCHNLSGAIHGEVQTVIGNLHDNRLEDFENGK